MAADGSAAVRHHTGCIVKQSSIGLPGCSGSPPNLDLDLIQPTLTSPIFVGLFGTDTPCLTDISEYLFYCYE